MERIKERYPIFLSFGVLAITLLASFAGLGVALLMTLVFPGLAAGGDYPLQLITELVMFLCLVILTLILRMGHIFRERGVGFFRSLIPAGAILLYYLYAGLVTTVMSMYDPLQPVFVIICFLLCMFAIGLAEELAFRGLITRMIFDKYGRSRAGVWLTVAVSGIIFGAMHLINAIGGAVPLSGVLIQVVGAAALGMCLSAVYLRCRNFWAVAFIHGFMDLCALISTGIFTSSTLTDTLAAYSPIMLSSVVIYGALAAFLLRPSKIAQITTGEKAPRSTKIKLILALVLLLAMILAVLLLTL